jgi:hypothetical protein
VLSGRNPDAPKLTNIVKSGRRSDIHESAQQREVRSPVRGSLAPGASSKDISGIPGHVIVFG